MTVLDVEVLESLGDEPELLAVADAIAQTQRIAARHRRIRLAAVAGVAAAAAVAVLFATRSTPDFAARALAAIGDEPVLHAVMRETEPPNEQLIQLSSGRHLEQPRARVTEMWIDRGRGLAHTVTRVDGRVEEDLLHTPAGEFDQTGRVWTCAAIARDPVGATRAGVSCKLNGDNGTVPRNVPEAPPRVDPALGAFVTGYQRALADGTAKDVGAGTVGDRPVEWVQLAASDGFPAERVAVDRATYKPVLVESTDAGVTRRYDVVSIETVAEDEANFARPQPARPEDEPVTGDVVARDPIELDAAAAALDGRAVWAGADVVGLSLSLVERRTVRTGYGAESGVAPREAQALTLIYGDTVNGHPTGRYVEIDESLAPEFAFGWDPRVGPPPPSGVLVLNGFGGYLRANGIFVHIAAAPTLGDDVILAVARALRPLRSMR
jgi:hypothetical protein